MWKRFLQSMGLLAVAMVAALYSTGTSREGNLTETLLAAAVSLAIAAWVGIRFVPRLAREVEWKWMPALDQYRLTREGAIFLVVLVVVLAAAVNTSNNLLYMVLSALLAVLLLSGILSAINLKSLELELLLPSRTFAGETLPISVRVRNHRRLLPTFSVQTEPPGNGLYFALIQPRESVLHAGEVTFGRRGRYTYDRLRAASRFPFGFLVKARHYPVDAECVCYPEILEQEELDVSIQDILGTNDREERGLGSDLYTIRDYVPSDSARHVHWKATAKTSILKTREFATDESDHTVLVFDRYGNPGDEGQFERLVSRAASLAFHLIQSGATVTLSSDEWNSSLEGSESTLDAILNYLALVEMSAAASPPDYDSRSGALLLSLRHGRN